MYLQLLQEMKYIMDFSPHVSDFRELSAAHPCVPQCATLTRGLSDSNATCSRPRQPPVRSYMPCGSVRDCFRPLPTTQLILCTLDAFPSDQGRFRVSLNSGNHFECIKGIFGPLTCRCCIGSALARHLKTQRPTTPYYHEAQCSSPFTFHSMLHWHAALVT